MVVRVRRVVPGRDVASTVAAQEAAAMAASRLHFIIPLWCFVRARLLSNGTAEDAGDDVA